MLGNHRLFEVLQTTTSEIALRNLLEGLKIHYPNLKAAAEMLAFTTAGINSFPMHRLAPRDCEEDLCLLLR